MVPQPEEENYFKVMFITILKFPKQKLENFVF